jgi:hypothetical protein
LLVRVRLLAHPLARLLARSGPLTQLRTLLGAMSDFVSPPGRIPDVPPAPSCCDGPLHYMPARRLLACCRGIVDGRGPFASFANRTAILTSRAHTPREAARSRSAPSAHGEGTPAHRFPPLRCDLPAPGRRSRPSPPADGKTRAHRGAGERYASLQAQPRVGPKRASPTPPPSCTDRCRLAGSEGRRRSENACMA